MADCPFPLTDKEKDTLRMILRGHDAKSMARELDLSVHTVNERLRNARRKLSVTSSKEAARLLLEQEGITPENLVPEQLGEARGGKDMAGLAARADGMPPTALYAGASIMLILASLLAMAVFPGVTGEAQQPVTSVETQESPEGAAARQWLELLDANDWAATYAGTSQTFRTLNSLEVWSSVSQDVRGRFGEPGERHLAGVEAPPTPENYRFVTFRTHYANRTEPVLETVTLVWEDGGWKVIGITLE